jgi:hypothetical protein
VSAEGGNAASTSTLENNASIRCDIGGRSTFVAANTAARRLRSLRRIRDRVCLAPAA